MQVKLSNRGGCQYQMEVELEVSMVDELRKAVYRDIRRQVNIPGYRKGKAPDAVLEKLHHSAIERKLIQRLIDEGYKLALKKEILFPLTPAKVSDVVYKRDEPFRFKADFELAPVVKLPNYKGIRLEKKDISVSDKEIEDSLKLLQESRASYNEKKEKVVPQIDDNLAKQFNASSLTELRERIRDSLRKQKQRLQKASLRDQVFDYLLKNSSLDIPPSLHKRRLDELIYYAVVELFSKGKAKEEIVREIEARKEGLSLRAEKEVRLRFILDEISYIEHIEPTEEELQQEIDYIARQRRQSKEQALAYLKDTGYGEKIARQIAHNKVIDFILSLCIMH